MTSVGTQTEDYNPLTSTPLKRILDDTDDQSSDFNQQCDSSWCIEDDEDIESEMSEMEDSQEAQQEDDRDSKSADKFIVCKDQLMSLFTNCPACFEEAPGVIQRQEGTFIKIKQCCSLCGFERKWQNQPKMHRNMPACNLLLSGAIHFSGYAWRSEQVSVLEQLKEINGGLILSGDCRSDSPGHCAKYGTYTVIEERLNKVLDLQLVQVGSMAAIKLESLATRNTFLKDIRQLSPQHQTFSLEAFHSLILHFAPKHTGFSYLGMHSRLLLAALHFNHNSSRKLHRTIAGEVSFAVRYPRFRKGDWVIRPIKESPSYDYAVALMVSLQQTYSRSPSMLKGKSAALASCAPQPLTASFQKVSKDEAVHQYLARHSRFNAR
uniref:Uncharacterized protein n=1 Tax=Knipowitschia caucasica TaxID=637954 RepID=A0AAV2LUU0_KNICA